MCLTSDHTGRHIGRTRVSQVPKQPGRGGRLVPLKNINVLSIDPDTQMNAGRKQSCKCKAYEIPPKTKLLKPHLPAG